MTVDVLSNSGGMQDLTCPECGRTSTTRSNLNKHRRSVHKVALPKRHVLPEPTGPLQCACGRAFLKAQSLRAHYRHCRTHLKGKDPVPSGNKGKPSPFRGLKLAERVKDPTATRRRQKKAMLEGNARLTPAERRERSERASKARRAFLARDPAACYSRCKFYKVAGVTVQGTWERDLAQKMLVLGVRWVRSEDLGNTSWPYLDQNGATHRYSPDFFLPDAGLQIEVKGYLWAKDLVKMQQTCRENPEAHIRLVRRRELQLLLQAADSSTFLGILQGCPTPLDTTL